MSRALSRYAALDDEIYIGGIYVRIFLQQPQYTLRRPEKFIEGLFEQHEKLAMAEGMAKDLGAVATGTCSKFEMWWFRQR